MPYYLLTITRPGAVHYKEAAVSKHHIDAPDLWHAKADADVVIDNHYQRRVDRLAVFHLYDGTGLVATRKGEGEWEAG